MCRRKNRAMRPDTYIIADRQAAVSREQSEGIDAAARTETDEAVVRFQTAEAAQLAFIANPDLARPNDSHSDELLDGDAISHMDSSGPLQKQRRHDTDRPAERSKTQSIRKGDGLFGEILQLLSDRRPLNTSTTGS